MSTSPSLFGPVYQFLYSHILHTFASHFASAIFGTITFLVQLTLMTISVYNALSLIGLLFGFVNIQNHNFTTYLDTLKMYMNQGGHISLLLKVPLIFACMAIGFLMMGRDSSDFTLDLSKYVVCLYLSLCACEGMFYSKNKIAPKIVCPELRFNEEGQQIKVNKITQANGSYQQMILMGLTILQIAGISYICYMVKIDRSLIHFQGDYRTIASLSIALFVIYTVSIIRKVTLLLPCLVYFFLIILPTILRILLEHQLRQSNSDLFYLSLPIEGLILLICSKNGIQMHKTSINNQFLDKITALNERQIVRKASEKKMIIDKLFWWFASYYLYRLFRGDLISMQMTVAIGYGFLVLTRSIH